MSEQLHEIAARAEHEIVLRRATRHFTQLPQAATSHPGRHRPHRHPLAWRRLTTLLAVHRHRHGRSRAPITR